MFQEVGFDINLGWFFKAAAVVVLAVLIVYVLVRALSSRGRSSGS
jgi:hypothetical protein